MCKEFPIGLHTCNKRSNKEELEFIYPNIDFINLRSNKDNLWDSNKKEDLKNRKENHIAFVNHSSFIGQMKDNHIKYLDNGEEELKHCFPYKIKI